MNIEVLIYSLFGVGLLSTTLVIMMLMFTPAVSFLLARFSKNRAVMCLIHKGNRLTFMSGKYSAGSFQTKKHGIFDETANSAYYSHKSLVYFVPEYYSHTMPAKFPMVINAMKKMGLKFFNYGEYKKRIEENKKQELPLVNGETIVMGDLLHMFPAIDDPHVREKEKAAEVIIERKLKEGNPKKWLIILLIGALVAYIIWQLFKRGNTDQAIEVVCKYPDLVQGGAQSVANLTL